MWVKQAQVFDVAKILLLLADRMENSFFWIRDGTLSQQIYLSPSFDPIWGVPREEIIAHPNKWIESIFEEDRHYHNTEKMVAEFKNGGRDVKYNATYRIYGSDGSLRWMQDVSFPIYDDHNNCVGFAGIVSDITAIKKYESDLEETVQKLEVTNQLKTDFIENMQHDMRTPIVGLRGLLEMLMETKNTEEISALIPIAMKSINALLTLCNEVVDFENSEYGRFALVSKPINIRDVVLNVMNLNSTAARHKNLALSLEVDDALPEFVKGDGYRLKKILTNVIGNSIKFTQAGEVKLAIYVVSVDQTDLRVLFEVSDTGIGIAENKKEIIFEKFTRLNPSNQEIYKGSGLGLSYVKKMVSELKGEIEVKSELGVGTTFCVTLPFNLDTTHKEIGQTRRMKRYPLSETESVDQIPAKHESIALPLFSSQSHARVGEKQTNPPVLLIEDDILACIVAKNTFERMGCHITTAGDVATAKKMLDSIQFNLVVSDIGLPDGTGFDIITHVKENRSHLNYATPFVALTAHSDEGKKSQAKKSGFLSMLQKPLTMAFASDLIHTYLGNANENSLSVDANKPDQKNTIIDLEGTMNLMGADQAAALEMLELFSATVQQEKSLLQEAYEKNDILNTRKLLHKIKGGLAYCHLPQLQATADALHEQVREIKQLSSLEHGYHDFYQAIENFMDQLGEIKS